METFFPTSTPDTIAQLTVRITDLEAALATEKQNKSNIADNYHNLMLQVDSLMEELGSFIRNGEIEEEIATTLAECFGRELTRKVVGHIRIEGDIELEIPAYFDLDDIADELDISIGQSYTSAVRIDYSDVSVVEIEEN